MFSSWPLTLQPWVSPQPGEMPRTSPQPPYPHCPAPLMSSPVHPGVLGDAEGDLAAARHYGARTNGPVSLPAKLLLFPGELLAGLALLRLVLACGGVHHGEYDDGEPERRDPGG